MKSESFDLVVRGGRLVSASGTVKADLGVRGGRIAAVGTRLIGSRVLAADGMYVLPGGIDPHVHLEMPVGQTRSSDSFASGTVAAACGGTTTLIDFVEPAEDESLLTALAARRALADPQVAVDYGLHMTLTNDRPATLAEVPGVLAAGVPSFKTYLTYEGFRLTEAALRNVLQAVHGAHGLVLVHAEEDGLIQAARRSLAGAPPGEPRLHALARPAEAEVRAIRTCLALAAETGARLYVVHVSTGPGALAIQAARQAGVPACGETCPQYLLLDESELARPGFEGAKFVCSPPLRTPSDQAALWQALADGALQAVGTDHCPFNYHGQKDLGADDFLKIPGGLPGVEARLALLHTYGVLTGRLTLERWVAVTSSGPAELFGLSPRKGSLDPGADADLVIFDPGKRVTLGRDVLHEQVDYTPYEGCELEGYPVLTLLRGQVVARDGRFTGRAGGGRFLPRRPAAQGGRV